MNKKNIASRDLSLALWLQKAASQTSTTNPNAPCLIASQVLHINRTKILSSGSEIELTAKQLAKMNNLLRRVLSGRTLPATLKNTKFHNLSLKVNGNVLSPRAESEELVNYSIQNLPKNSKVIELGTGSGAIGLALKKARPDLFITLTDVRKQTLSLAKQNARRNKLAHLNPKVEFKKSNLLKSFEDSKIKDSYIIANLPYLNKHWNHLNGSRLKNEPSTALYSGKNGLQLILNLLDQFSAKDLFNKNNWVLLEHDPIQTEELKKYCQKLNLKLTEVTKFISKVSLT